MSEKSQKKKEDPTPDYLTPLLERAPAAWALIRANEIRALDDVSFVRPVLDVGCGDGVVAAILLSSRKGKFDWGIDLSSLEIKKARKSGSYKRSKVASVYKLPFKDNEFQTVFSNSVIEHIPDLNLALSEISRVLKDGGSLIITVPSSYITSYLFGTNFFTSLGLRFLSKAYGRLFNKFFNHHNLYNHQEWEKIFKRHSLKLKRYRYYHTPEMIRVHEALTYLAIPYQIFKTLTGYWPMWIGFRRIFIAPWLKKILYKWYLEDARGSRGGSLLLIAEK